MFALTVENVFNDFKGRRAGLLKALTIDVEEFIAQCDPEKESMCLYGCPDGRWDLKLASEMAQRDIPEPALGINFARDEMDRKDWLFFLAAHSDAWLLAVSHCLSALLDKNEKNRLFDLIDEIPTLYNVVHLLKPVKEISLLLEDQLQSIFPAPPPMEKTPREKVESGKEMCITVGDDRDLHKLEAEMNVLKTERPVKENDITAENNNAESAGLQVQTKPRSPVASRQERQNLEEGGEQLRENSSFVTCEGSHATAQSRIMGCDCTEDKFDQENLKGTPIIAVSSGNLAGNTPVKDQRFSTESYARRKTQPEKVQLTAWGLLTASQEDTQNSTKEDQQEMEDACHVSKPESSSLETMSPKLPPISLPAEREILEDDEKPDAVCGTKPESSSLKNSSIDNAELTASNTQAGMVEMTRCETPIIFRLEDTEKLTKEDQERTTKDTENLTTEDQERTTKSIVVITKPESSSLETTSPRGPLTSVPEEGKILDVDIDGKADKFCNSKPESSSFATGSPQPPATSDSKDGEILEDGGKLDAFYGGKPEYSSLETTSAKGPPTSGPKEGEIFEEEKGAASSGSRPKFGSLKTCSSPWRKTKFTASKTQGGNVLVTPSKRPTAPLQEDTHNDEEQQKYVSQGSCEGNYRPAAKHGARRFKRLHSSAQEAQNLTAGGKKQRVSSEGNLTADQSQNRCDSTNKRQFRKSVRRTGMLDVTGNRPVKKQRIVNNTGAKKATRAELSGSSLRSIEVPPSRPKERVKDVGELVRDAPFPQERREILKENEKEGERLRDSGEGQLFTPTRSWTVQGSGELKLHGETPVRIGLARRKPGEDKSSGNKRAMKRAKLTKIGAGKVGRKPQTRSEEKGNLKEDQEQDGSKNLPVTECQPSTPPREPPRLEEKESQTEDQEEAHGDAVSGSCEVSSQFRILHLISEKEPLKEEDSVIDRLATIYDVVNAEQGPVKDAGSNMQSVEVEETSSTPLTTPSSQKSEGTHSVEAKRAAEARSLPPKKRRKILEENTPPHDCFDVRPGNSCCGSCQEICTTDKWSHCKCVPIAPEVAHHIEYYQCPPCSNTVVRKTIPEEESGKCARIIPLAGVIARRNSKKFTQEKAGVIYITDSEAKSSGLQHGPSKALQPLPTEEGEGQDSYENEQQNGPSKALQPPPTEEGEGQDSYENEQQASDNVCASCGGIYTPDQFWIGCDGCDKWFHGHCEKITPQVADRLESYECRMCLKKWADAQKWAASMQE